MGSVKFIDLGLPSGMLWGDCNLGAKKGWESGNYYAWGEINPKESYNESSYQHSGKYWFTMKKYCQKRIYGKVDRKTVLQPVDNAVTILNKNACIPSTDDFEELIENCTWEFCHNEEGDIAYYICTSKINKKQIIFPITGNIINKQVYSPQKGYYWTSDLNSINCCANIFFFNWDKPMKIRSLLRAYGACIRPVMHKDFYEEPKPEPEIPETPETPDIPVEPEKPIVPEDPIGPLNCTIMTYNVRYWNGENDTTNSGYFSWPLRKNEVFEMIKKHSPDVLGLQEVTNYMYQDIMNALPTYTYLGVGRNTGTEYRNVINEEQAVILYKTDKFECIRDGYFFLSETPDQVSSLPGSQFNRLVVWACLKDKETKNYFYVYSTHFDHGTEDWNKETRKRQAEIAVEQIISKQDGIKVFFIGDFNSEPIEPTYNVLTEHFSDSFVKTMTTPTGGYLNNEDTYTGMYSTSDNIPKRVDYIFTLGEITVISYNADNDDMGLTLFPSDHLPVIVKASL